MAFHRLEIRLRNTESKTESVISKMLYFQTSYDKQKQSQYNHKYCSIKLIIHELIILTLICQKILKKISSI